MALALNNLAWLESTCADVTFHSPRDAVRHAQRATVLAPEDGNYWNTLGAACYRAGEWEDAKAAFTRSMALRTGDSFDWFFLSMVELKLGDAKASRRWYDRAVEWYQRAAPRNQELYRFHAEAALELGLPKPEPPTAAAGLRPSGPPIRPGVAHRALRRRNAESALKTPPPQ